MKKTLLLVIALSAITAQAQQGYGYFNFGYGVMDNTSVRQYHVSYEINNGAYNSWEIILEAQIDNTFDVMVPVGLTEDAPQMFASQIQKEELFLGGAIYEPLLGKHKNLLFNFRTGLMAGAGRGNFVAAVTGGFEASYTLPGQFVIFLQQGNYYIINIDDRFRHSIQIGLKIPL